VNGAQYAEHGPHGKADTDGESSYMSIFGRFLGKGRDRASMKPLYEAIVARARDPQWYLSGEVADSQDGRFDMIALVLSLVLIRLEAEGERFVGESALLAEVFIDDIDGQLREIGVGDVVVGKHVGKMVGALGGRLTAYREAFARNGDIGGALIRNLYRGEAPGRDALAFVETRLSGFFTQLKASDAAAIVGGSLPGGA